MVIRTTPFLSGGVYGHYFIQNPCKGCKYKFAGEGGLIFRKKSVTFLALMRFYGHGNVKCVLYRRAERRIRSYELSEVQSEDRRDRTAFLHGLGGDNRHPLLPVRLLGPAASRKSKRMMLQRKRPGHPGLFSTSEIRTSSSGTGRHRSRG